MSSATIVLIEDDEASQYFYGTVLRRQGYTVRSARFGSAGLKSVRDDPPDVVVLDLGLPELDGFEVLQHLKEDPATRHIPVIVVTVHVFEHDRARAMEAGCDEFLPKPLPPSDLVAAVERVLKRCVPKDSPAGE